MTGWGARRTDPVTSHEAAIATNRVSVEDAICNVLDAWTHRPMTADEIATIVVQTGWTRGGVVTAISRLVNAGRVEVVDRDGVSLAGRRCSRYKIKEQ